MKSSSSYINHFIQPDTLIPNPANPQSWNRYGYVSNNPVNFIDPTGHWECNFDPDECAFLQENNPGGGSSITLPGGGSNSDSDVGNDDDELGDILGLDNASNSACTIYSCTVGTPGICPLGQTCYLDRYVTLNLDPDVEDYLILNFSYKFGSASAIFDRHGEWYLSLGFTIDLVAIPFYSFSMRRGSIDGFEITAPDAAQTRLFLTGTSYNSGAGLIVGASKTWAPGAKDYALPQTATEYGLYVPASLTIFSASYTVAGEEVVGTLMSIFR